MTTNQNYRFYISHTDPNYAHFGQFVMRRQAFAVLYLYTKFNLKCTAQI